MSSISSKRLGKELKEFHTVNLTGVTLLKAEDFKQWLVCIEVMGESLYQNEVFVLRFTFDAQYPISSPEVVFVDDGTHHIPIHPHVYSNGHICASILGQEWSPVLSVASVCITLQSMLASCKNKERPRDNDRYVRSAPLSPKNSRFHYDDDTV